MNVVIKFFEMLRSTIMWYNKNVTILKSSVSNIFANDTITAWTRMDDISKFVNAKWQQATTKPAPTKNTI